MRVIYASFLTGCLALVIYVCVSNLISSSPEATAYTCLRIIKSGDVDEAATMFGDNSCRCPPRGGWASMLKYEWGQDPNLAFLVGHPFTIGSPRVTWIKDDTPYIWPWEAPESAYVDFPLGFAADSYRPYFLPLDMAYGHPMTRAALDAWLDDPKSDDWKGFSSRLRAGLDKGVVPPEPDKQASKGGDKPPAEGKGLLEELLGPSATRYVIPRDAAPVLTPAGGSQPAEKLAGSLPRLTSVTLRLNVQRLGQLKPWRVAKLKYMDAVVETAGKGPVTLLNPKQ